MAKLRRLTMRACVACDWAEASLVPFGTSRDPDCPWCHAPTRVAREEGLFDSAQAAAAASARSGSARRAAARSRVLLRRRHGDDGNARHLYW